MLRPGVSSLALRHIQLKAKPLSNCIVFLRIARYFLLHFVTLQHQAETAEASAAAASATAAALASSCVQHLAHLANDIKCSGYK